MEENIIHVQWEGPISFLDVIRYDSPSDYGIYQVCGPHPSYGPHSLLYIGRAQRQPFSRRLRQEGWEGWQNTNGAVEVFLGRLSGSSTPENDLWEQQIARVEQILIYAHRPAHNSSGLNRNNDPQVGDLHILNWGSRGRLLPEVSGARWSSRFNVIENYYAYGAHREKTTTDYDENMRIDDENEESTAKPEF